MVGVQHSPYRRAVMWVAVLSALCSGLANLYSVATLRTVPLEALFPMEFQYFSRSLALLAGIALVMIVPALWKRKRRAWNFAVVLAGLSVVAHLVKGPHYEEALISALFMGGLFYIRPLFTVRSREVDWPRAMREIALLFLVAIGYGVAGFWLLDRSAFGINFHWQDALQGTVHFLSLQGADPTLIPRTRHAEWFLESMYLVTLTTFAGGAWLALRPVYYIFRTLPSERAEARKLLEQYGRCAQDFYKIWPDKSLFFTADRTAFLAYRVARGFAVVLGDPVGRESSIGAVIEQFTSFCRENDWGVGFHQVSADFLSLYRAQGFHTLKIGDLAVVDLPHFTLEGKAHRDPRTKVHQFEKAGVRAVYVDPPIPSTLLAQLREVSDAWLQIPGRRERQFTLGQFKNSYVRNSPVLYAVDPDGKVLAFMNIAPSFRKGETSIDLMRRREDSPNGIMDYLFAKLFMEQRARGFQRFDLGLSPMSGFQEGEPARPDERAIHAFFQHLNFLFSFRGLRAFKAKYATSWEPRYVVYRRVLDLPYFVYALGKVSSLPEAWGQANINEEMELDEVH